MKKLLGILILPFLLLLPLSASAGYIGTYQMIVSASGEDTASDWSSYLGDYDGLIDGDSYEVFCVEEAQLDRQNPMYDFYTIDTGLLSYGVTQDTLEQLIESTWIAGEFADDYGITTEANNAEKVAAQNSIWNIMFTNTVPDNPNSAHADEWLLAVNPANNGVSISWGQIGQNYLVPTSAIPEPANMLLLGTGLLGLVALGRKKIFKK